MKKARGESQRIYWQQWLSSNGNKQKGSDGDHSSRRELITSSAAIRINPEAAKAKDVTQLLRDTLNLSSLESSNAASNEGTVGEASNADSLVLVGTLYSLPKDFIQFEHEPPTGSSGDPSLSVKITQSIASSSSDPYHVVKTLQPDDNPLAIRDKMMEHLRCILEQAPASTGASTIAPKAQWYFVPRTGDPSRSPIPSCIELDGYCTSMEEEDEEADSDSEMQSSARDVVDGERDTVDQDFYDLDLMLSRCPFLNSDGQPTLREDSGDGIRSHRVASLKPASPSKTPSLLDRDIGKYQTVSAKELRRFLQLSQATPSSSGYLLKQSSVDPHVWRRVYCVLTDDHLWYTYRIPYATIKACASPPTIKGEDLPRMGKRHGRISLGRALLLEPNAEYTASPLYRIPNSFEVVSSRGTSHMFRASNRSLQRQWIQALSTKIIEAFENSLMDHAELIVADESTARNRRLSQVAIEPLYSSTADPDSGGNQSMYLSLIQNRVLRLGMNIAEYREQCRHVKALLPAKQPVVAHNTNGHSRHNHSPALPSAGNYCTTTRAVVLDSTTQALIHHAWDAATRLLHHAMQVAMEVQQFSSIGQAQSQHHHSDHNRQSLSHSLQTMCGHIEYVITGQHRPVEVGGARSNSHADNHHGLRHSVDEPPPFDLFDFLLAELHVLVNMASEQQRENNESS